MSDTAIELHSVPPSHDSRGTSDPAWTRYGENEWKGNEPVC